MANAGQKKMITKEEYLQSLEIIESYHKQLQNDINGVHLTPINQYIFNVDCSIRLKNILKLIERGDYSRCHEKYIENIDLKKMSRVMGCGQKTIKEFINLRGY
jgi:hypothetical protein